MSKSKNNNLTIRIFSIIIAVILWVYVMGEVNPKVTKEYNDINVELTNIDEVQQSGLMIMSPKEVSVSVKVEGRNNDVLNTSKDSIRAYADLRGLREGSNKVNIYVEDIENLEIVDYYPKEVLFECDKIVSREVPITLKITGKAEPMTALGDKTIKPSTIFIKGPESWTDKVDQVVATVDITGQNSYITQSSPIMALDKDGNEVEGIVKEPNIVEVSIPVLQTKDVNIEVQTTGEPLNGYTITNVEVNPKTVKIKGTEEVLQKIESIKTSPIDVGYTTKGIQEEAKLILPDGVELVEPVSVVATINVEEVVNTVLDYTFDDVIIFNLSSELIIDEETIPDKITVEVSGAKSVIQNISNEDVDLNVDLKDLEAGEHEVKLNALSSDDIKLVSINPDSININLINRDDE